VKHALWKIFVYTHCMCTFDISSIVFVHFSSV
jgi:hypothetical protein